MDTNAIISRINAVAPGALLEKGKLGRSDLFTVWIDLKSLPKIAEALKTDPAVQADWLENLCVAQVDRALMLSYLLRSSSKSSVSFILRGSVELKGKTEAAVATPSVRDVWPMAIPMEAETGSLFGIRFGGEEPAALVSARDGYPLRKSFRLEGRA